MSKRNLVRPMLSLLFLYFAGIALVAYCMKEYVDKPQKTTMKYNNKQKTTLWPN